VIDTLGFLVRFWELRARHATLGVPLSSPEQLELLSLMQLITGDFPMPERGSCARPANAVSAQLNGQGTIQTVEVRHVCASALLVASGHPVSLGEGMILRAADAVAGVEYVLPCSVAWVHAGQPIIVALAVDGIPTRSELAMLPEAHMVQAFPIGRQSRLIG
jgi:hypothetical protein